MIVTFQTLQTVLIFIANQSVIKVGTGRALNVGERVGIAARDCSAISEVQLNAFTKISELNSILTFTAVESVRTSTAEQRITARTTFDRVITKTSFKDVRVLVTGQAVIEISPREVLDVSQRVRLFAGRRCTLYEVRIDALLKTCKRSRVDTFTAVDCVTARTSNQDIITFITEQCIITAQTIDNVIACKRVKRVCYLAQGHIIVARRRFKKSDVLTDKVLDADKRIGFHSPIFECACGRTVAIFIDIYNHFNIEVRVISCIVAFTAVERVIAKTTSQDIVTRIASQSIIKVSPDQIFNRGKGVRVFAGSRCALYEVRNNALSKTFE